MMPFSTYEEAVQFIENNEAALLYFFNDNCEPCKVLRPKVIELVQTTFPHIKTGFIDSEHSPAMASGFNVFSNPTLIVFFEGKEYLRASKYVSIPQLRQDIDRIYSLMFGGENQAFKIV